MLFLPDVVREILHTSGSGTSSLIFNYLVEEGDEDSDLSYISSDFGLRIFQSGSVKDAAGNDADLTLPAPGATNSLSANKNIVIDGVKPVISSILPKENSFINKAKILLRSEKASSGSVTLQEQVAAQTLILLILLLYQAMN